MFEVGGSNSKIPRGGVAKIQLGGWDLFLQNNFFSTWGSKIFQLGGSKFLKQGAPTQKSKSGGGSDLTGGV